MRIVRLVAKSTVIRWLAVLAGVVVTHIAAVWPSGSVEEPGLWSIRPATQAQMSNDTSASSPLTTTTIGALFSPGISSAGFSVTPSAWHTGPVRTAEAPTRRRMVRRRRPTKPIARGSHQLRSAARHQFWARPSRASPLTGHFGQVFRRSALLTGIGQTYRAQERLGGACPGSAVAHRVVD